jgi:hypothetical protein
VTGTPADTAAAIDAIAREVQRLTPSWERPETFHEQKAEIIGALRALARSPLVTRRVVRFIPVPAPAPLPPPPNPALPSGPTSRRAASLHARPSRRSRHRYPHPGRQVPGQTALGFESL